MKKKILVITTRPLEANISSSIRKITTINSLIEAGADVTVLTTNIPRNSMQFDKSLDDLKDIKIIRIKTGTFYEKSVKQNSDMHNKLKGRVKKVLRNLYFKFKVFDPLKRSVKYVNGITEQLESKYHIVLSMSDPKSSHLLATYLIDKKIIDCDKYYQVWGDPMYIDITNRTFIPSYIIKTIEKNLIKKADKLFYVSPLTMEEEKKIFPQYAEKMEVLYPTYKKETMYPPVNKIIKLGYFGDYNSNIRNIMPLYNAIKNTPYNMVIFGNSDLELKPTENICISKRVSFEQVKKIEKDVDLLIHISNNRGTQIPGKIYQYMGTNKPILFVLDGKKDRLFEVFSRFNRCIFCENKEEDIIRSIEDFNKGEIKVDLSPVLDFSNASLSKKILN